MWVIGVSHSWERKSLLRERLTEWLTNWLTQWLTKWEEGQWRSLLGGMKGSQRRGYNVSRFPSFFFFTLFSHFSYQLADLSINHWFPSSLTSRVYQHITSTCLAYVMRNHVITNLISCNNLLGSLHPQMSHGSICDPHWYLLSGETCSAVSLRRRQIGLNQWRKNLTWKLLTRRPLRCMTAAGDQDWVKLRLSSNHMRLWKWYYGKVTK